MSLKDDILERVPDLGREVVKVRAWKCKVLVRGMTGQERFEMAEHLGDAPADVTDQQAMVAYKLRMLACTVVVCVCDPETGARAFAWDDLEWLTGQPVGVLDSLAGKGMELSGIGEAAFEDAVKN